MRPAVRTDRPHPTGSILGPTRAPRRLLGAAALALLIAACGPPSEFTLTQVEFDDLPGWRQDAASAALPALAKSCALFAAWKDDRAVGREPRLARAGTAADWRAPCAALAGVPPGDDAAARAYFERWFAPHRVSAGGTADGLFTGYYEAELKGARQRGGRYTLPLHARPGDLLDVDLGRFAPEFHGKRIVGRVKGRRLEPYPARASIVSGKLDDALPVLLWLDDLADAFLLHIQGSGRVRLAGGGTVRVGYDGNNGHPFVSIGRKMLDRGLIEPEDANMQAIRRWLRANPKKARALLDEYPRYIFFREIVGEGPIGAQGVALTPGRSLAVDPQFVPLGAPLWLDTNQPGSSDKPLRRLVVAQDVGGAILGVVRGDLFWGTGEAALEEAGRMKQPGQYYLLLPRAIAKRVARAD